MQLGPSHHPVSRMSGVWPLRILIRSVRGFWRFIVSATLGDPDQPVWTEMDATIDELDAVRELLELPLLRVAGPVAASAHAPVLADESDGEASFSVYKTNNPSTLLDQPFLLIFRTGRIVTAHDRSLGRVPDGYTGFPAYSQMRTALL